MPIDVAILADDLTGAADTAAAFLTWPRPVSVRWSGADDAHALAGAAGVVAVNAATRAIGADEAAARIGRLAAVCRAQRVGILYKKIDSLLRGHVAAEVRAAAAADPRCLAVVAPAFPEVGRTTVGGRVLIAGSAASSVPALHEVFAPAMRAERLDLADVRGDGLDGRMTAAAAGALLCDAETDDDLSRLARAGLAAARPILWVGSSGLARALARHPSATADRARRDACRAAGPILAVVGSASPAAQAQADRLRAEGVVAVRVAAGDVDGGAWLATVEAALDRHDDVLVALIAPSSLSGDGDAAVVARLAARLAAPIRRAVGGLVLTGGDTASAILRALGCTGLDLIDEPEPGVVLSTSEGRAWPVVTKAGSFGTPATLAGAVRYLRGLRD